MYRVGEFSKITGIPTPTLRYYDEIDLLKPSHVDSYTGYRSYDHENLKEVKKILELKEIGCSLEEIILVKDDLSDLFLQDKEMELEQQIKKIYSQIEKIHGLREELQEKRGLFYQPRAKVYKLEHKRWKSNLN